MSDGNYMHARFFLSIWGKKKSGVKNCIIIIIPLPISKRSVYPRPVTKLHLMVWLLFWRSGKCGGPLHCSYSQFSDLEW